MDHKQEVVEKLNDLIQKNFDACEGYKKAAEKAKAPALKSFLNDYSVQRDQFVSDLRNEIVLLGGEPEASGTLAGDAHRAWMDMKTALSSDKDEAVLEECMTGEQAALSEYQEVLQETYFPSSTENILRNQYQAVENAYSRIKTLEEIV